MYCRLAAFLATWLPQNYMSFEYQRQEERVGIILVRTDVTDGAAVFVAIDRTMKAALVGHEQHVVSVAAVAGIARANLQ